MSEAEDAEAAAAVLHRNGVNVAFAPASPPGAPLPPGLETAGIAVARTLHEQTAAFAADGWAKATRGPGILLVGGRTGLPNALTGVANASAAGSPLVVVDDRRPGPGGAADPVDHAAMVRTLTRAVATVAAADLPAALAWACEAAVRPPRGPVLVEVNDVAGRPVPPARAEPAEPDKAALEQVAELLGEAERPVLVSGSSVYWSGAETAMRRFAERLRVPVVMNGLGRGTLPTDHELALSRTRPGALREADLVVVAGTPLDFRLGYGRFGPARVVHLCEDPTQIAAHVETAGAAAGDLRLMFERLADLGQPKPAAAVWADRLGAEEADLRAAEEQEPTPALRAPGLYRELRRWLDRDAIVIGDGGDFVSYAGRFVDTFTPGCFLDPGPYGCLGIGIGHALGARLAHPERQVVVLFGDGAAGFSLMETETLVRHGLPAVLIVGNNDGWGLEKHHMEALYGYSVLAGLTPGTRYDEVARGLGAGGEFVREAADLDPALQRAFAATGPFLVNVALDPADAYVRSTALA